MHGPAYETPAEIQFLQKLGGDAVGMSTLPEVEAAKKNKMSTLVLSVLTNYAAGLDNKTLKHEDVLLNAKKAQKNFIKLVKNNPEELNNKAIAFYGRKLQNYITLFEEAWRAAMPDQSLPQPSPSKGTPEPAPDAPAPVMHVDPQGAERLRDIERGTFLQPPAHEGVLQTPSARDPSGLLPAPAPAPAAPAPAAPVPALCTSVGSSRVVISPVMLGRSFGFGR